MSEKSPQKKSKTPEAYVSRPDKEKSTRTRSNNSVEVKSPEKIRAREDVDNARAKMLVAESAYLRALRLNRDRNSKGVRKSRVEELHSAYDQSRVDFSNKVNESVRTRLSESGRGMAFVVEGASGKSTTKKVPYSEAQKIEVENRYRRMVLTRDTVDRAHRKRLEMLGGGWFERSKFGKVLGWYVRANKRMETQIARIMSRNTYDSMSSAEKMEKQKKAHKIARGLRILTFAGIGGIAGGLAVAGHYVFRSVAGIFSGLTAGKYAGKRFMRNKGAVRAEKLADARGNGEEVTVASMRDLDALYKKGSAEALEKGRILREISTALILGGGISYSSADLIEKLPSVQDTASLAFYEAANLPSEAHGVAVSALREVEKLPTAIHDGVASVKHGAEKLHEMAHEVKLSAEHKYESVISPGESGAHIPLVYDAIVEKGQGSDALFANLKQTLQKAYPDSHNAPPMVQYLLQSNQHALSARYGFAKHGVSMLLRPGEKLEIKDDALIFIDHSRVSHVLSEVQNGHVVQSEVFTYFDKPYLPNVSTHDALHASESLHASKEVLDQSGPNKPILYHETDIITHTVGTQNNGVNVDILQETHSIMNASIFKDFIEKYENYSMSEVLYGNIPIQHGVHGELMSIVSKSGIGPANNETIAHFIERAEENISSHTLSTEHIVGINNLHVYTHQTYLYETANGKIVCFGGSFDARSMIAYEYLSSHNGVHVLLEGAHDNSTIDISSSGSFIAGRMGTSSMPGTFIPPSQFTERITP